MFLKYDFARGVVVMRGSYVAMHHKVLALLRTALLSGDPELQQVGTHDCGVIEGRQLSYTSARKKISIEVVERFDECRGFSCFFLGL